MRRSERRTMVELLRGLPDIEAYSDRELVEASQLIDVVWVDAGHVLTAEGEVGREAFVIVEGRAEVSRNGTVLATLGDGEFVGEMAMLAHQRRTATVIALTPMRLLVMTPQTFGAVFDHPGVGRRLARGLAERLARLEQATDGRAEVRQAV